MRRAGLLLVLLAATPAAATPLEDRLREQLQSTTTQLRAAQAQQATLEAAKAAAETERDALKAKPRDADPAATRELSAARAQNSALRGELDAGKAALADANRRAADASARLAVAEAELTRAKAAATESTSKQVAALKQCIDANTRLVATGRDLVALHIKRYGRREFPPLQLQRTKIENEAQAMADRVNADTIILNASPDMPK